MSNAEVLGRFVWHELLTTDTDDAAAFYPKVAAVAHRSPPTCPATRYSCRGSPGRPDSWRCRAMADNTPAHWLMYVGTPDVDATCAQAQTLGARVCKAPADIPNVGRFAVLADPAGGDLRRLHPGQRSAAGVADLRRILMARAGHHRRVRGTALLRELFGWTKSVGHDMGAMGVYQLFAHGGSDVGGMCNTQGPSTPPSWLSYVHVPDCQPRGGRGEVRGRAPAARARGSSRRQLDRAVPGSPGRGVCRARDAAPREPAGRTRITAAAA